MAGDNCKKNEAAEKKLSRRAFVVGSGTALAGGALGAAVAVTATQEAVAAQQKANYPRSTRYLVYDSRGCAGCLGCMLACSLAHDGAASLSLSRIQVHRAVLKMYPLDIHQNVCRQCPVPLCVENCPTGACHVSTENGNIRMIDEAKCIGCQMCLNSCPQLPHRIIWDPAKKKCTKCDMCVNTPYYNKKGGPNGAQACVEACPSSSLRVVDELPEQADLRGYDRNLQPPPKPKPQMQPKPEAKTEAKPKPQASEEFNPRVDVSKLPPAPVVNSPASKSKPGN
jgi:protein NrfC